MKVVVESNYDWTAVDAKVIDTLNQRGFCVSLYFERYRTLWEVVVPEWCDYLSAVWHVYADISRGSEGVWPLRCKRTVKVHVDNREYAVRYWVTLNGIQYGSISV